ncbi:MAG: MBL fold metallo-hydrolase, partial [Anaerolineae bacterium]|nr:hypothetical protein [Thermoflexales bacterium]MDW8408862.1 MBL fold metallo-hydrolase [Anaerolineae bacterium]
HTPGHSQGHVAFLWPHEGGVLFAGDIAAHIGRLGPSILYEDYAEGKRSLRRVSSLEFAIACFGHGAALLHNAQEHFRRCWRRAPD